MDPLKRHVDKMKPANVKKLLKRLNSFVETPTEDTFQILKEDSALAYLATITNVLTVQHELGGVKTEMPLEQSMWFNIIRELNTAIVANDMSMALYHAVKLQSALTIVNDRQANNKPPNAYSAALRITQDIVAEEAKGNNE